MINMNTLIETFMSILFDILKFTCDACCDFKTFIKDIIKNIYENWCDMIGSFCGILCWVIIISIGVFCPLIGILIMIIINIGKEHVNNTVYVVLMVISSLQISIIIIDICVIFCFGILLLCIVVSNKYNMIKKKKIEKESYNDI